jgi:hypothetical protein
MAAEQQGNIYINGWKSIDEAFVYVGGWKRINQAYVYHNGAWRRFYAYDAIAPTVSSFTLSTLTANATYGPSTTSVTYSLIFSEQVTGLTAADFTYTGTSTTWTISAPTNPSNDKKTYVITATSTGAPATETVQIRLNANTVNDIVDGNAFNLMTDGPFLSPTINIDNTKPSVSSFASGSAC